MVSVRHPAGTPCAAAFDDEGFGEGVRGFEGDGEATSDGESASVGDRVGDTDA